MQYDTLQKVASYSSRSDTLKKKKRKKRGEKKKKKRKRSTMAFACDA